jgi:hypothetical protein
MDQKTIAEWNREHLCLDKHYSHGKKATSVFTCTKEKGHPESEQHSDGKKVW